MRISAERNRCYQNANNCKRDQQRPPEILQAGSPAETGTGHAPTDQVPYLPSSSNALFPPAGTGEGQHDRGDRTASAAANRHSQIPKTPRSWRPARESEYAGPVSPQHRFRNLNLGRDQGNAGADCLCQRFLEAPQPVENARLHFARGVPASQLRRRKLPGTPTVSLTRVRMISGRNARVPGSAPKIQVNRPQCRFRGSAPAAA